MSMLELKPITEYTDGRTKQSFKDETNINNIIEKHARMGTISHLEQWGGEYGDLSDFDFQTAQNQIAHANTMFEQLPSTLRNKFQNSPERFFNYVNDPDNSDNLEELLPDIAKRGNRPIPGPKETPDIEPELPEPAPEA